MANVKIRAFVQKFGTHGTSLVIQAMAQQCDTMPMPHPACVPWSRSTDEMARELSEALEEVLHEDPESGH